MVHRRWMVDRPARSTEPTQFDHTCIVRSLGPLVSCRSDPRSARRDDPHGFAIERSFSVSAFGRCDSHTPANRQRFASITGIHNRTSAVPGVVDARPFCHRGSIRPFRKRNVPAGRRHNRASICREQRTRCGRDRHRQRSKPRTRATNEAASTRIPGEPQRVTRDRFPRTGPPRRMDHSGHSATPARNRHPVRHTGRKRVRRTLREGSRSDGFGPSRQ